MAVRFTLGTGQNRVSFDRAPRHTKAWIDQKKGFRLTLGMPEHGRIPTRIEGLAK